MSEITRLFSRSGREEQSNHWKITIDVNDDAKPSGEVEGYLSSEFGWAAEASWEPIFNLKGEFSKLDTLMTLNGTPAFTSGLFTKLYYKGGSHIKFNTQFRIFDWNGDGNVVRSGQILTRSVLPLSLENIASKAVAESQQKGTSNSGQQSDTTGGKFSLKTLERQADRLQRFGVRPVNVTIGNFFRAPLVIEGIDVKLSKEVIDGAGPLFGDFTVRFSTQDIPDKHSFGNGPNFLLKANGSGKRFSQSDTE